MDFEFYTQSFIIRIWLVETAEEAGPAMWHGHITHVPSGKRHYFRDLDEIRTFIVPYLESIGVKFHKRWRVQQCLERLKKYLDRKLGNGGHGTD